MQNDLTPQQMMNKLMSYTNTYGVRYDHAADILYFRGKGYDLKTENYEWLRDYIPDFATISFMLHGMEAD